MLVKPVSFETIKRDVLEKIRAGHWAAGDKIPGEMELAESYGCSRTTVNRAMRELAEIGIVERRRKAGTRVAVRSGLAAKIDIPIIRHEIEKRGFVYRYSLVERTKQSPPEQVRAMLSHSGNADVLHLRCVHFADGHPYQYEDRWINLEAVPSAGPESFEHIGPNEWLVRTQPWVNAEHSMSALNATPEMAQILRIKENDAVFLIERRTWSDDLTITWVRLYHPGATFRMTTRA